MRRPRLTRPSRGFSLPFVLIAAAILLTGGLMLALRSSDGLLSVLLQAESSDARDAAETGITRILGELNRPRNRGLLVKDGSSEDPDGYLWDRAAAAFRNPCLPRDSATTTGEDPDAPDVADDPDDPNDPDDPSHPANPSIGFRAQPAGSTDPPSYNTVLLNAVGAVVSEPNEAVKSYRLLSVKRQPLRITDDDDRPSLRLFDANGRGTVLLTVEGAALRNGQVISSVQLQEELQLVPKCCGVSFGGAHGDSDYQPDDQGESVCISGGWGFVAGMAQNGSGSMRINGVTTIVDASGNSVNPLYCVAASTQECSFNPTSTAFTLRLLQPTSLPEVRTNPVLASSVVETISRDTVPQAYPTADADKPFLFCTTATATRPDSLKDCPEGKVTINAAAPAEMFADPLTGQPRTGEDKISYCVVANYDSDDDPESAAALHCNLTRLDYSQLTIEVVGTDAATGGRALRLYFPVAPAGGGDVIRSTGGGSLRHEGPASRFALFGCADCSAQAIKLAGSAEGLNLFAWFPMGTITVAGASGYEGVLWANRITSNGGVGWTIPSSAVLEALQLARFGLEGDLNPPLFDWVARSVRAFRWLGR